MIANNVFYPDQQTTDAFTQSASQGWNLGGAWNLGLLATQLGAGYASKRMKRGAQAIETKYGFKTSWAKTAAEQEAVLKSAESKLTEATLKRTVMVEGRRAFSLARGGAFLGRVSALADAAFLAPLLFGMTYNGFRGIQRLGFELERPEMGGRLSLSTMAFTDRQRSIQKMQMAEINGRTALGSEAALMH